MVLKGFEQEDCNNITEILPTIVVSSDDVEVVEGLDVVDVFDFTGINDVLIINEDRIIEVASVEFVVENSVPLTDVEVVIATLDIVDDFASPDVADEEMLELTVVLTEKKINFTNYR